MTIRRVEKIAGLKLFVLPEPDIRMKPVMIRTHATMMKRMFFLPKRWQESIGVLFDIVLIAIVVLIYEIFPFKQVSQRKSLLHGLHPTAG